MLKEQEKKLLFNVSIISIVLCLVVCIPFTQTKVTTFELIFKFIIVPVLIIIASLINFNTKYRNYRPAQKFATITSYVPALSYCLAILFNTVLCLVRDANVGGAWLAKAIIVTVVMVVLAVASHMLYRAIIVFSKNMAMLIDGTIVLVMIIDTIFLHGVVKGYKVDGALANGSIWFILLPILFGLLGAVLHAFTLRNYMFNNDEYKLVPKADLLKEWMELREKEYNKAEEVILNSLYNFTKEQLGIEDADALLAKVNTLEEEKATLLAQIEELKKAPKGEAVPFDDSKFMSLYERLIRVQEELAAAQKEVIALSKRLEEERAALKETKPAPAPAPAPQPVIVEDPHLAKKVAEVEVREEKLAEKEQLIAERNALVQEKMDRLQQEKEMTEEEKARLEAEIAEKEAEISRRDEEDRLEREADERARLEAEENARIAAEEKEKRDKALYKALRPTYDKIVAYVDAIEGVRNVIFGDGKGNKFYIEKKLVLIMQKGSADYKITFLANDESFLKYMKNNADCINRATSPAGTNWLKFTNKGVNDEKFVKEMVKGSVDYINNMLKEEALEKERIKQEKEEAKRKAREAAKEEARKQKEAAKADKAA